MNIVIIGSGNVATVLGRKILSAGHHILQVYSRNREHAAKLASNLKAEAVLSLDAINRHADLILISVSDDAYTELVKQIPASESLILHTAGSVPIQVLKPAGTRYGVLYPLQSFRPEAEIHTGFPILIDAGTEADFQQLKKFAESLSWSVMPADDELRLKYHLAGVFVNNFTNHLFALTDDWCQREDLSFSLLYPLIRETAARVIDAKPEQLQTGPAIRNDEQTLEKHRRVLEPYPAMLKFYERFTRSIQRFYDERQTPDE